MIALRKMSIEEINNKPFLINHIDDLYHDVTNSFFEYVYNGEVRWLYSNGYTCTIIALDGEYISYASFVVDEDYNLTYMEFDDFEVYKHVDGNLVLTTKDKNVSESLAMFKRENASPSEQDGIIMHRQINNKTHEEMVIGYLCNYRSDPYYYAFNFDVPFYISFLKGKREKKYLIYETTPDYYSYDVITLREFGPIELLLNNSFNLQREENIRRYFKVKHESKRGVCTLLVPLSHPYKIEELDSMISKKGFKRAVSKNTIDYYNNSFPEKEEFHQLTKTIKEYDNSIDERMKKKSLNDKNI